MYVTPRKTHDRNKHRIINYMVPVKLLLLKHFAWSQDCLF